MLMLFSADLSQTFCSYIEFIGNSELEKKIFEQAKVLLKTKGAKGIKGMSGTSSFPFL
jgi:hypothetical protein